jgi:hypothetical protein
VLRFMRTVTVEGRRDFDGMVDIPHTIDIERLP